MQRCAVLRRCLPPPCLVSMYGLRVRSSSQSLGPFRPDPALCWASLTLAYPGWRWAALCPAGPWLRLLVREPLLCTAWSPQSQGPGGWSSQRSCMQSSHWVLWPESGATGWCWECSLPSFPMYSFSFCLRWTGWGLGSRAWSWGSQCRTQGGKPETASSSVVRSPPFPQEPPACREDPGFAWLSWPAGPLGLRH